MAALWTVSSVTATVGEKAKLAVLESCSQSDNPLEWRLTGDARLTEPGTNGCTSSENSPNAVRSSMISKTMDWTPSHKYDRIERERRFLVERFPHQQKIARVRRITDRYIEGTNLRLREEREEGHPAIFKLTQKIPEPGEAAQQGYITTMYLNRDTHERLTELAARVLAKIRYSVPPFGVDVFEGVLDGLVMAEAEFESAAEAEALVVPDFVLREVSGDPRFSGGVLAGACRRDVEIWLAGYGVKLGDSGARGG